LRTLGEFSTALSSLANDLYSSEYAWMRLWLYSILAGASLSYLGAANAVQTDHADTSGSDPDVKSDVTVETSMLRLKETGERRICLRYRKIKAITPVAQDTFLFESEGKLFLNTTQSECFYDPNVQINVRLLLNSANVCKNNLIRIYAKNDVRPWRGQCTLSDFREVEIAPLE
jgi:hypothetical protein